MALQLNTTPRGAVEHVWPLPHITEAVSALRHRVEAVLAGWGVCPEIAENALLVVSELLTNAIIHALPPAELRLSWDRADTLRVEVTDAGSCIPGARSCEGDPDEHGRGELIVHALAARHGIRAHRGGITRWADLVAA
ncbi:ATP-binding protein [Streptomyces sp. NPDC026672]|uniref:ATP-binding protein n=1 Tax=unclassified Streptomyces TaxID=2593676 RepID=UPI0034086F9F